MGGEIDFEREALVHRECDVFVMTFAGMRQLENTNGRRARRCPLRASLIGEALVKAG